MCQLATCLEHLHVVGQRSRGDFKPLSAMRMETGSGNSSTSTRRPSSTSSPRVPSSVRRARVSSSRLANSAPTALSLLLPSRRRRILPRRAFAQRLFIKTDPRRRRCSRIRASTRGASASCSTRRWRARSCSGGTCRTTTSRSRRAEPTVHVALDQRQAARQGRRRRPGRRAGLRGRAQPRRLVPAGRPERPADDGADPRARVLCSGGAARDVPARKHLLFALPRRARSSRTRFTTRCARRRARVARHVRGRPHRARHEARRRGVGRLCAHPHRQRAGRVLSFGDWVGARRAQAHPDGARGRRALSPL